MTPEQGRKWMSAALNGEPVDADVDRHDLLRLAFGHGLGPLFAATPFGRALDGDAGARLAEEARLETLRAALLNDELRRVIPALTAAGVPALLIKGAHLAHAVYPKPELRVRGDSDMLIPFDARVAAERALVASGYRPRVHVRGAVILGQFQMERLDRNGVGHQLDVHWRVSAPLLVERVLPAALVLGSRVPIRALGDGAFGPSLEYALALACMHIAAHHWPRPDLIWLYDLRRITDALGPAGSRRFVALAQAQGFGAFAREVLLEGDALFPSPALRALLDALPRREDVREPALALLDRRQRRVDELLLDLKYATWGDKSRLVREHLLPDAAYMRASWGGQSLAGAYARRIARGARRWLARAPRPAD